MRRQRTIRRQVMCRQHASSGDNASSEANALQVMCRHNASSGDNASSDDNASSGNCRRNASSRGIMCLAMCRPKASSASAGMLIPPLRALCLKLQRYTKIDMINFVFCCYTSTETLLLIQLRLRLV